LIAEAVKDNVCAKYQVPSLQEEMHNGRKMMMIIITIPAESQDRRTLLDFT
jgi:hypothetical protein